MYSDTGHSVLLRSDGTAVTCGDNRYGQCNIPRLPEGVTYTQVDTGMYHTAYLVSDGSAVARGRNENGECNIPVLPDGVIYTQVAAGYVYTILLMSDGAFVVCGDDNWRMCDCHTFSICCARPNIPTLPDGVDCEQIAAGPSHTVLLNSDGSAAAYGSN